MADSDSPAAVATPKKGKGASKPKKPKSTPSHPKVSEMVNAAISTLKERGGSSLQAIKKYIASHYKVDIERLSPFIKKYLKTAVASGTLVQTKGKGATGSFRMSASATTKEKIVPKSKKPKREVAAPKKPKATPKKVAKPKKAAEKKKPKKPAAAAKKPKPAKSPKKPKAAKSKAAKPKKAKATPKKAGGKKGKK